jgi:sugar phosphate isomerase/epimerase
VSWSIGIATGACSERPLPEVLEVLGGTSVPGIEIGTAPAHFDLRRPEALAVVAGGLRRVGLAAVSIHAPFGHDLDLAHPDRHRREAGLEAIALAAGAIRQWGGTIVVAHPSDLPRSGADIGARLDMAAASLQRAAAICRTAGVRLAVESPLPHLVGGHPDEFAWILGHVGDGAGVCLDTGHIALGRAWPRFVDVAGSRLLHVHASDNHGQFDDHLPPGDGTIDWTAVTESLKRLAFDGWMILEVRCPDSGREPFFERALRQAAALCG